MKLTDPTHNPTPEAIADRPAGGNPIANASVQGGPAAPKVVETSEDILRGFREGPARPAFSQNGEDGNLTFHDWDTGEILPDYEGPYVAVNLSDQVMHTWKENGERAFSNLPREEHAAREAAYLAKASRTLVGVSPVDAYVKSLKSSLPDWDISFGYIGNIEKWGDDRSWRIWADPKGQPGPRSSGFDVGGTKELALDLNEFEPWLGRKFKALGITPPADMPNAR